MPQDIGIVHFTGIGGIGMSGIAEVLHALGYQVQGSDQADGANVERLRKKGIKIYIGHDESHVRDAAIIVTSSAIKNDNPEVAAARAMKLPVVRRAEMLAELMRLKWSIAIGGTHGKTTTTSLVGAMLEEAGYDPTIINGGIVNRYGTNTRLGKGDWMVVEADESDGTFTRLPAAVTVVTNIDPEHLDHYGDFNNIRSAFRQFVENIPFYGFAVLCSDHPGVQGLLPELTDRRIITYGLNPQADVQVSTIRPRKDGQAFDVTFKAWLNEGTEETLRDVFLPMLGEHNVLNACAALSIAHEMSIPAAVMKRALEKFEGVKRRFTKTGEVDGITIIDDYGHHPAEIRAVLKAARQAVEGTDGQIHAVMQPHRYTRLHDLFDEFCTCFNDADSVLIADVYAAGETPIEGADKTALVEGVKSHGHRDVSALPSREALSILLAGKVKKGDYIVCLGAGDITKWAYALPKELEQALAAKTKKRA
jgi:UDP-N-acetylmuramate--alanine ligase